MIQLTFTPNAVTKVREFMKSQGNPDVVIRISVPNAGPQGYNYQFFLDEAKNLHPSDVTLPQDGFRAVVDAHSAKKIDGATVDWVESVQGTGFKVDNPNRPSVDHSIPVEERILELFEQELNPMLDGHSGRVELIEVDGPRAYVRLSGGCQGCASSTATLKQGIEVRIKEVAPEILEVIDTTDHAAGTNPYFQH